MFLVELVKLHYILWMCLGYGDERFDDMRVLSNER